jgi:hypothetical protein
MSFLFIFSTFIGLSFAQQVGVQVDQINAQKHEDTVISIQKKPVLPTNQYEITEINAEIVGDAANLSKEARANWKSACSEWKQETKELNKENTVISLNCGQPQCSATSTVETICKSQAKGKVKIKVN